MKLRSLIYAIAAGVILLLLISAGGFYWFTSQSSLAREGDGVSPTAAMFVSKQSPVMVSLLVNPDRLPGFQGGRSRQELDQFKQSWAANIGLDYRRDIQPWLGDEITLAVTNSDFDRNPTNGKQRGVLLVATTKDAERSRQFLQLFWEKQAIDSTDLVFEQYQGVKLIYNRPSAGANSPSVSVGEPITKQLGVSTAQNSIASAVVGDRFVVFANHPKVLKEAINNVQAANLSIKDDPSYQLAVQNFSQPEIGLAFVNLPALSIGINSANAKDAELNQPRYESLAIALSPNRQGLIADTALLSSSDQQTATPPTLIAPVGALEYIPANSALSISSTNLHQFWNELSEVVATDATLSQLINQPLAVLEKRWGINLAEDIFKWVQGEYALAMLPRADRTYPDWIFVTEKSPEAELGIARLDAIAKTRGLSVGSIPLDEQAISTWTKLGTTTAKAKVNSQEKAAVVLEADVQGVHAPAGKYEIFTTSVEAMDRALKIETASLLNSADFKEAIAPFNKSNNGYLYIDWAASKPFLEQQLPILKVLELVAKPIVDQVRSLTITSYGSEPGIQRSQIFIHTR